MTEHLQHEVSEVEIKQQFNPPPEGYLAGSVIVGAILIAASIFYNTKLVLNKLDGGIAGSGNVNVQQQAQGANPQPAVGQPQANAQNNAGPVDVPARNDAPVLGKDSAKVTFVEFADFQCPYCQNFVNNTLGQLKSKYIDTGKMKVIYRYFPLPFHQNAQKAAEAAECAYKQGKFWEYHDLLFKSGQGDGTGLAVADLKKYAGSLGLNTSNFDACLDGGAATAAVAQDVKDGQSVGVNGTPTFLIVKNNNFTFDVGYIASQQQLNKSVISLANGNTFVIGAQPTDAFDQAIADALK